MPPRKSVFVALVLTLILTLPPLAALAGEPLVERLDNGLTVVVQRLNRAPAVAVQVWVRAGSRLESEAEKGITHQIEHMIFKGTPSRGLGRVAGEIEAAGGRINAYTSFDHTVYHTLMPAEAWELGLDVLADAIKNSIFDAEELEREKQVVLEEWRRSQDNPHRRLTVKLFERAFVKSPYRHPVIGYEKTIKAYSRKMILDYIAKWYTGDKMTVVVVGQIDPERVMARAKELFKDVPAGPKATFRPPKEPPQREMRFTAFHGRVQQAYLALGFKIPGLKDPNVAAYDLLAQLLGGGNSALLTESLWAHKGLVTSLTASAFTPLDQGLFWISMSMEPPLMEQAITELWRLLGQAASQPFGAEAMARAKLAFEADYIREKETVNGQASKLGFFENLMGGLGQERLYLDRVKNLTAEEIRKVAAQTFRPENMTAVLMLPQNVELPGRDWLARLTPALAPQTRTEAEAPVKSEAQVMDLPGGAKLLVLEDHSLPLIAVDAVFLGGLLEEPADQAGIFSLLASTWTRGAVDLPASELDRRVEDMAGAISAYSGRNTVGLTANFLSRFADEGLELFCRVLLSPTFPAEEVAKRKSDQLAAIKRRLERPEAIAFDLFRRAVYNGYPYARDRLGTAETLTPLKRDDLAALHARIVRSDNLVLAVVGDVSATDVHRRLSELLADLKPGFSPAPRPQPRPLPTGGERKRAVRKDLKQVHTLYGFRAADMADKDSVALDVLARALAGQSGRMFVELRDKKSLAYALTAINRPGVGMGAFTFYVASAPQKLGQVKSELAALLRSVLDKPLTAAEFTRARAGLLADWVLDSQSLAARASRLALYERLGMGYDYEKRYTEILRALTPEEVRSAARRWLDIDKPIWVTVGPEEGTAD